MKRVIAFLGTNPQPANYAYQGQVYHGRSFPEALCGFLPFDRLHVFVTPMAREKTLPTLLQLGDPRLAVVDIPDGRDSAEMWDIFDKLVGVVDDGDTLIFDITHAFRSIPFFVMLALAFLKSAYENVTIERVLYGGLLFGDPAPVIDLTEFIGLLDWMSATDQFVGFGNSQALVRRVRAAALHGDGAADERLKMLQFATALDDVSRSLQLVMPDRAMNAADSLRRALAGAAEPLQRRLPPFGPLAARVDAAFGPMALANDRYRVAPWPYLRAERRVVHWYLDRQLLLQAIDLAYEWLISYGATYHRRGGNPFDDNTRKLVRRQYEKLNSQRASPEAAAAEDDLEAVPDLERVLSLFHEATEVRNTLLHAGRTARRDRTPADWEGQVRRVCLRLSDLSLEEEAP